MFEIILVLIAFFAGYGLRSYLQVYRWKRLMEKV